MLGNLGTHLINYPTGRWGYVGTLPLVLATIVDPTKDDIMAGRYVTDPTGKARGYKFPRFDTEAEAREFAETKNVTLAN